MKEFGRKVKYLVLDDLRENIVSNIFKYIVLSDLKMKTLVDVFKNLPKELCIDENDLDLPFLKFKDVGFDDDKPLEEELQEILIINYLKQNMGNILQKKKLLEEGGYGKN